ncbi:nicotinate-nucleotide adenylyltransferase [Cohnella rhizosphaerae]|uniref:Probable nicotinate-nucleotide adenylyltransferase n=1 Tax=Cohnella rhizosphaerae TaxID=1457232 RepID=A0A9X4KVT8_9BACL|nr:nicotinate-nucleotide adenylyltransferase [Cohnella rhizosphaerae]MDG0812070.1 nicotinate-nucleotide adenylyltransferase [Cohnella rhizosphaerae]
MRRIGLMGGTFDPVHIGHLLAAEAAREAADLSEVWFIPTSVPVHKPQPGASGAQRRALVETAIAEHPSFRVEAAELDRQGASYTIDTVLELRERYPDVSFYWIVGSDMRDDLPHWRRIEELAELVVFIALERPGAAGEVAVAEPALPDYLRGRIVRGEMPGIGISSTDIRRRCAEGRTIRYMVPERVRTEIERMGLYGSRTID